MKFYDSISAMIVFAAIIPHNLFTILYLLTKKDRRQHDIFGSIIIFTLSLIFFRELFLFLHKSEILPIYLRIAVYPLLFGPLLFLYAKSLVIHDFSLNWNIVSHFLPFLIVSIFFVFFQHNVNDTGYKILIMDPTVKPSFLGKLIGIVNFILMAFYSYRIVFLIRKHRSTIEDYYSSIDAQQTITWLYSILLFFLFTVVILITIVFGIRLASIGVISFPFNREMFHYTIWGSIIFTCYQISFFLIRQNQINIPRIQPSTEEFSEMKSDVLNSKEKDNLKKKYEKSGLDENERERIVRDLEEYMQSEKPYLSEDINLSLVASKLNTSINYLSQVVNEKYNRNFYNFINDFRVQESIGKLKNPANNNKTLLQIGFESGFNSKSSFNSYFKRTTGKSPTEFREINCKETDGKEKIKKVD